MNMDDQDRLAIEAYAKAPNAAHRVAAINAYRKYLHNTKQEDWNYHMRLMSEVDTPSPDYLLRARYRVEVLAKSSASRQEGS